MTILDRKVKAVETALELAKQLLTLSSGFIALSVTFMKDIFGNNPLSPCLIIYSWGAFTVSILCGLVQIGALTSLLNQRTDEKINIDSTRVTGLAQWIAFFIAIVLFGFFATKNLSVRGNVEHKTTPICWMESD
jgi:hypothetical protein